MGDEEVDLEHPSPPRRCLAEALGTYLLVLLGCGAVHASVLTGAQSGVWQVAIVWGVAIAIAIYAFGAVSGAHLNPAITLALAARGRFPWRGVIPYAAAQLAGAFLAAATLFVLFNPYLGARELEKGIVRGAAGSELTGMCYGEYFPNPGPLWSEEGRYDAGDHEAHRRLVPATTAFLAEFLGTLILALVVFAVTDGGNSHAPAGGLGPPAIGLTVSALISVLAPLTQAGFNPARDMGPRLFAALAGWGPIAFGGSTSSAFVAVYVVAPCLGGIAGASLYDRLVRLPVRVDLSRLDRASYGTPEDEGIRPIVGHNRAL